MEKHLKQKLGSSWQLSFEAFAVHDENCTEMKSVDPTAVMRDLVAGSFLSMVVATISCAAFFSFWVFGLVHCIKHRHDKDRLMWVLINFFGGGFGTILYFAMGRQKPQDLPPEIGGARGGDLPRTTLKVEKRPSPFFNHAAMQDEKERVRAIEKELWGSNRKSK